MSKLEERARALPEKAENDPSGLEKEMDAFAKELNTIRSDKTRIDLAKTIDWNEAHDKINKDLPKVDIVFDDKGHVDSIKRETKDHKKESFFDDAGRRVKDVDVSNGDTQTKEFDAKTGKKVKDTINYKDGAVNVETFDPITGKMTHEDMKWKDGSSRVTTYDPKTGNAIEQDWVKKDGSTVHYEWSKSGQVQRKVEVDKDKTQTESIFDPDTGNKLVTHVMRKDGSNEFTKYDPKTGEPISIDKKDKDGNITHWKK